MKKNTLKLMLKFKAIFIKESVKTILIIGIPIAIITGVIKLMLTSQEIITPIIEKVTNTLWLTVSNFWITIPLALLTFVFANQNFIEGLSKADVKHYLKNPSNLAFEEFKIMLMCFMYLNIFSVIKWAFTIGNIEGIFFSMVYIIFIMAIFTD